MHDNKRFLELRNAGHYWQKLQHDYVNLKSNSEDTYIAFNFFITAYHLIDWIFQGKYSNERSKINNEPVIKICSHIANGIKHFETNSTRHNHVNKIETDHYIEDDYVEDGYFENPIAIHLSDDMHDEFGTSIMITELADEIMKFWKTELSTRGII